jgi:FkbM family methyltransferase
VLPPGRMGCSIIEFIKTLQQIAHCESVGMVQGISRHLQWQFRRAFRRFPCELPIAGSRLHIDRPGGVAALVNAMGEYDYNNMNLLRLLLSSGRGTFVDIGANIGSYTLVASEVAEATVVSVEPHPLTFAALQQNVWRNRRRNVHCLNLALSGEDGEVEFTDTHESALNHVIQGGGGQERQVAKLRVPCRRFDTVCRALKLVPDFIKIDVEGYEDAVLKGFGEFAGLARIIIVEGGERSEVRSWMQAAGFSGPWFSHFKRRLLSSLKQPRPEDPVFVRKDYLRELREMYVDRQGLPNQARAVACTATAVVFFLPYRGLTWDCRGLGPNGD